MTYRIHLISVDVIHFIFSRLLLCLVKSYFLLYSTLSAAAMG